MNRDEKAAVVEDVAARLGDAGAVFAVDYRGITVTQAAALRAALRESGTTFTVVKNRLAKRALERAGTPELEELLVGPTAIAFVGGDPVTAAKAIATFSREHEVLAYKGGLMDGQALDPDSFAAIARLPGVEVLRGQFVGVAASPITGLARGLGQMIAGLAQQLNEISERGLAGGDAPPGGEPVAAEAPAAEAPAERRAEEAGASEGEAEDEPEASGSESTGAEGDETEED